MHHELETAFSDAFFRVAKTSACDRVLLIGCANHTTDKLKSLKKKLIIADSHSHIVEEFSAKDFPAILLPGMTSARMDRLKAAMVGAMGAGYLNKGEDVLCALTNPDTGSLDTMLHVTAGDFVDEHSSLAVTEIASDLPPQLLEVVVDLALRIGREGYEGRTLGALFVLGDSTVVMERSHPLTLNPFQGYSEAERNVFDVQGRDAVRTFAMLDGAFVIRDDGVIMAAGRHIRVNNAPVQVPLGMGARHTAAASVSSESDAIGIVVSQSSGSVRVFQDGKIVLEITPSGRRGGTEEEAKARRTKKKKTDSKKSESKKPTKRTKKKATKKSSRSSAK